jgi:histidine triad (HIT) family protein
MSACIFCRIAAGEIPADVVHQTPGALAFLDRNPVSRGHVLVIPRAHATSLPALAPGEVDGLFQAVREVMRKIDAAFRPAGMNVGWNHGEGAGQEVLHLHVHVIPRHAPGGRGIQVMGEGRDGTPLAEVGEALRRA